MRLRKGFGTVRKLTGNRRNKYAVHPPKVDGVRPKAICYTDDYYIGVCCLNAWHNGKYYAGMELDLKERKLDDVFYILGIALIGLAGTGFMMNRRRRNAA